MTNASVLGAGLMLCITFITTAEAKLYKWVDDKGVTHYGETLPPEYAGKDNVQLNDKGRVIKKTEKVSAEELRSKDENAARKLADDKSALEQRRKDSMLLGTFSNENEIDLARDRNLQQAEAVINSIQLLLKSAQQNLAGFQQEAEQRAKAGRKIPDSLQTDIAEAESQATKLQHDLAKAQEKSAAIRESYAADKARYRELTGRNKTK